MAHILGSPWADRIRGTNGSDVIYALGGNDVIFGSAGPDYLDGGAGIDTVDYSASTFVHVDLAAAQGVWGDAQDDILVSIENVIGSAFGDRIIGDGGSNLLSGLQGDDVLHGGAGSDRLLGGEGIDLLLGGSGADVLDGGAGSDWAQYFGSSAAVTILLYTDQASGGDAQGDQLDGIENVLGSFFDDTLWGDDGANQLAGGSGGNDTLKGFGGADVLVGMDGDDGLYGMDGDDVLQGEAGDDRLEGQQGNDLLLGGAGVDTMIGGSDADTFRFTAVSFSPVNGLDLSDRIVDFSSAEGDKVDLALIDANTMLSGDQAFTPIGINVSFNGVAGELRYNGGLLEGDVNGDAVADFQIQINVALQVGDVIL
jgi:Ca2+-binding RTX toxin-like protein